MELTTAQWVCLILAASSMFFLGFKTSFDKILKGAAKKK